jgi:hypothetical protein
MPVVDASDRQRYGLVPADIEKRFAGIDAEPGGLAYLGRNGVVRGLDGHYYYDLEAGMTKVIFE